MGWKFKDPDAVFNHYYDTVFSPQGHTEGVYEEEDLAHGPSFQSPGSLGMKAVNSRISALRAYDNALNYDKHGFKVRGTPRGSGQAVDLGTHRWHWNKVNDAEAKADDLQNRAQDNIEKRNDVSCPRAAFGAIDNRVSEEVKKHGGSF